jgi:hypothetical protein
MLEKVISPLAQEVQGTSSTEKNNDVPLADKKEPAKVVSLVDRKKEK